MVIQLSGTVRETCACAWSQAFIDAAAAAELQTELAARVGEWQGKVGVLLDEQDARPAFDLQASGSNLLDRLSDLSLRQALVISYLISF